MSSDLAIKVSGLSKCYQIYDTPRDRLKQFFLPKFQKALGCKSGHYFREFWALKDIDFEVRRGEAVGILGRNGSGKSTLLQIITGTLGVTTGTVETHGRIAALLELGSGFNPEFSGRENIYLNGALLGLTRHQIDNKFDAIASFADIGDYIDQPVKAYSSGMLVRLAFSVQVQVEPDILIVDEALAVGDWLFQKRCFQRIEKLVSDGTTLLFVSHDQESIRTLTNRALLLNRGVAQSWGVSSTVVLDYRRLLHEEESAYFRAVTQDAARKAEGKISPAENATLTEVSDVVGGASPVHHSRSEQLSFGDGEVQIEKVEILDADGTCCSVYYPGDRICIRISCRARESIDHLNVGVRLRNKEGVKIYSWGTLNQDMSIRAHEVTAPVFWDRKFYPGEGFSIELSCPCTLGVNLYEVQVSVSYEETPDYMGQRILQWLDEAAFFQVLMKKEEYFFGGVVDLQMKADW